MGLIDPDVYFCDDSPDGDHHWETAVMRTYGGVDTETWCIYCGETFPEMVTRKEKEE